VYTGRAGNLARTYLCTFSSCAINFEIFQLLSIDSIEFNMPSEINPTCNPRLGAVDVEVENDLGILHSDVAVLVEAPATPTTRVVDPSEILVKAPATPEENLILTTAGSALCDTAAANPSSSSSSSSSSSAICTADLNARRSPRKRQKLTYSEDTPFAVLEEHCTEEKRKDQRAALARGEGETDGFLDLPEDEFPMQYLHSFLSHADVLRALELIDIPDLQNGRDNVRRHVEDEEVRSLTTGVIPSRREGKICVAEASLQRPALTKLLVEFGKRRIPDRDFRFNAITINEDLETNLHTDRANLGPSYIIALGDFVGGGELWTHDRGLLNVKHNFQKFDGNVPHKTMPWKNGSRYVLIYYTNKYNSELSYNDKHYLANTLGFRLPSASHCEAPFYRYGFTLPVNERLDAARESFTKYMESESKGSRRISTPGAIIHGIELYKGILFVPLINSYSMFFPLSLLVQIIFTLTLFCQTDKIVKNFSPEERVGNQQWHGAFVGTVRYYDAPFFGVFYDDGDFEDMDLEELATCTSREPDAIAPIIAKEAIALITGSVHENLDAAPEENVVGYALAPVTLTEPEMNAMRRKKTHSGSSPNVFAAECLLKEAMKRMAELKEAMAVSLSEGRYSIDSTFRHPVLGIEAILDSRAQDGEAEVYVKWTKVGEIDSWELRSDLVLFSDELPAPSQACTANLLQSHEHDLTQIPAADEKQNNLSIRENQPSKQASNEGGKIQELVRMTPSSLLPAKASPVDGFLVRLYFSRRPAESLGLNVGMDGDLGTFLTFYVPSLLPASCAEAAGALKGDILISIGGTLTRDLQVCCIFSFLMLLSVFFINQTVLILVLFIYLGPARSHTDREDAAHAI